MFVKFKYGEGSGRINKADFDPKLHEEIDSLPEAEASGEESKEEKEKEAEKAPSLSQLTVSDLTDKCAEMGIAIEEIEGTGKGGAVVRGDLERAIKDKFKEE